jgi:cysteinyl-tRNA synthetase
MDDELATSIKRLDDHVLGLDLFSPIEQQVAPQVVQDLAQQRRDAKTAKDRPRADRLRDEIVSH